MTDGRAIAYSEREREFTFAKNHVITVADTKRCTTDHKVSVTQIMDRFAGHLVTPLPQ